VEGIDQHIMFLGYHRRGTCSTKVSRAVTHCTPSSAKAGGGQRDNDLRTIAENLAMHN
jgi:hypothetical protein